MQGTAISKTAVKPTHYGYPIHFIAMILGLAKLYGRIKGMVVGWCIRSIQHEHKGINNHKVLRLHDKRRTKNTTVAHNRDTKQIETIRKDNTTPDTPNTRLSFSPI